MGSKTIKAWAVICKATDTFSAVIPEGLCLLYRTRGRALANSTDDYTVERVTVIRTGTFTPPRTPKRGKK
jgi:hypothetical protein